MLVRLIALEGYAKKYLANVFILNGDKNVGCSILIPANKSGKGCNKVINNYATTKFRKFDNVQNPKRGKETESKTPNGKK